MAFLWFEIFWLTFVFCMGACAGSFLNVVVARLPLEQSLIWPGSRCGSCFQPIRGSANLPIVSYLLLRGRCRTCGARFSSRYFWVELGTAVAFAGLFYLDVLSNWQRLDFVANARWQMAGGWVPWQLWAFFVHRAMLLWFLLAASLCDLDGRIIPLPLTLTGTLCGLLLATLMPWPWPSQGALPPAGARWNFLPQGQIPRGVYSWPLWGPLPDWLPPGSLQLGLLTGLAGAAAGNLMMRSIRFVFEQGMGKEALGLGDADLMMMTGAFLGWQMVVVSFFFGTFAALFFALPMYLLRGSRLLPFGPGLAIGIMTTMLGWRWIGPEVQAFFFDWFMLVAATSIMGIGMFFASLFLGWRGRGGG
jgi:leader peptidase (prepilin peptidase) / N-methyltransferase